MDARERYDDLADDVLTRKADVEATQMMGMPALKRNGKLWVGFWKGEVAFKLTDPALREQALAIEGARLFDPGERGRPMMVWVVVPEAHADRWPQLAEQALR
jgi:hypothetical protein